MAALSQVLSRGPHNGRLELIRHDCALLQGDLMRRLTYAIAFLLSAAAAVSAADGSAADTRKANRLLHEASPYLRQHAYNPVDWYPWGKEVFERAARENKPILLSIGYSTCHWCHVMARESYENPSIARVLNTHFIAIKVDRERRPHVDETYMLATQIITHQGGWPNNVFLTPDRKPFYAGTYFPPSEFKIILNLIAKLWREENSKIKADADDLARIIAAIMTKRVKAAQLTPRAVDEAANKILKTLDSFNGGFSAAPKFPQAPLLQFLLRLGEKDGNARAMAAVILTLERMLDGGIHDHAGGGFHRYAVDQQWRVPHFEKMLYTQAQLTHVLLGAYRVTGEWRFAHAARRTLDYVLADLTNAEGGFYSARDSDSNGEHGTTEEGAFYVWTPDQLRGLLGAEDAKAAELIFGVTAEGNFEGKTVLHFPQPPRKLAAALNLSGEALAAKINRLRQILATHRAERQAPKRDDKIVTAWNGMMISAFAHAALELEDSRLKEAAVRAAGFIWSRLYGAGGLKRIYFDGHADIDGTQEDYAHLALAFVAIYDLTNDRRWLERAETLTGEMVARFLDKNSGDFFMTASPETIGHAKMRTDSSIPSGNAVALELFAKLAHRSPLHDHRTHGEALLAALSGIALEAPSGSGYALLAGDTLLRGETGPRQFAGKGTVRVSASIERSKGRLTIHLAMAPGWHINAHEPLEDNFVATEVKLEGLRGAIAVYPEAQRRKLGFHQHELALYEGRVDVKVLLPNDLPSSLRAVLKLQACSDEICLEPETVELTVPVNTKPAS